ncbi:MAG: TSUP family transporter [Treponemataceae bacterium]
MHFDIAQYLVLGVLSFAAGFIDSIAGGGGLISLPAYLSLGIPAHFALGTNKFSSSCGTSFATFRYFRHGSIDPRVAVFSVAGALIGSPIGAKLALILDERYLKIILLALLPAIAIVVLLKKNFGGTDRSDQLSMTRVAVLSGSIGFSIGMYDGFFGPGTGTFLILAFTGIIGLSLMKASGNAKIVNLSSNIGALATFLLNGKVLIVLGIVAALFNIAGNWIGSGLAIKRGSKIIRPIFVVSVCLLLAKILFDMFGSAALAYLQGGPAVR